MRNDLPKTCKEPKRYSVSVQYEQRLYCTETAISEVLSVKGFLAITWPYSNANRLYTNLYKKVQERFIDGWLLLNLQEKEHYKHWTKYVI